MRTSPPASRRGPARRALATALVTIALTPSCKALNPAWYETGAGTESGSGSDSGGTTEDPTPTSTQGSDGTTAGASGSDSDGSSDATSPTTTEDPSTSDPVTVTETTDAPADMGGGAPMCDALEGELTGIDLKLLRDGESLTDACGSTTTVYGLYSFLQGEMELIDTDHCKTINEPSLYRLKGALPAGYEPNFEGFECVELWVRRRASGAASPSR